MRVRPWSRTNQLIVAAAASLGVEAEALASCHTDFFMVLRWPAAPEGAREVIVSKTRSPFLTQVAQTLANNKFVARERLAARGLPVIQSALFDEARDPRRDAAAAERARALIAEHGRVVVKPNWGNRGVGITTGIEALDELLAAYAYASEHDRDEEVLVEPHVEGVNLRVAVVGGRFVAAAELARTWLRGDGRHSARALLASLDADPRRGTWDRPSLQPLDRLARSEVAARLAVAGLELDDPLPVGVEIELCFDEAETIDRSESIHPGWVAIAVEAARALGVDVAGVDLRAPAASLFEGGPDALAGELGGVLEVNALPALHLHALPTVGEARPVFEAFVAYCLQLPGAPPPCARIPG